MGRENIFRIIIGEKVFEGKVVRSLYEKARKVVVKHKDKTYEYDYVVSYLNVAIPKKFKDKVFVILAVDPDRIEKVSEDVFLIK